MLHPADLIPYARNAKKHDESQVLQIAGSIKEFGFNNPVLIDQDNGIIAGHGRVMAALKLGLESIPTVRLSHLSDVQRRAYILADNKLAELGGGWDLETLRVEVEAIRESDIDESIVGFTSQELNDLLNHTAPYEEIAEVNVPGGPMKEHKDAYEESVIRQIILIYPVAEYDAVIDAMGKYAEQYGLSNNTQVVSHLLEANGYAVSQRQTEED